jgi:hypothetical protein
MQEEKDFLFFKKVNYNGILYNGDMGKAVMICTPSYVFLIGYENFQVLNHWGKSKGTDEIRWKFHAVDVVFSDFDSVADLENYLKGVLSEDNVFEINALDKFSVQAGWLFFGGLTFRKAQRKKIVINLQPKKNRIKMREFYSLS